MEATLPELRAGIPASPEFAAAWKCQNNIAWLKDRLAREEEKFKQLLEGLAGKTDEVFAVTDMRRRRVVDVDWLRQNLPDTYEETKGITNAAIGEIVRRAYPERRSLFHYLQSIGTKEDIDAAVSVTVSGLEDWVGKRRMKELEGKAVRTVFTAGSKTQIVCKHPERWAQLEPGEEIDDDE